MRAKKSWPRQRAGFTLVEIVVAVGIIAIAAAMAVPSLRDMLLNMEMARLDSAAKQIYLVGQNRLVSMRESGSLLQLSSGNLFGSLSLTESGVAVEYSVASNDDTSAPTLAELLPSGSIDHRLDRGHYLIVFLKGNQGLMREVYYSESAFSAPDAATLERWRSNPAARRAARIGFYDGGGVQMGAVKRLDTPTLEVVNGETLELRVTLPGSVTDPNTVKAKIRITDISGGSGEENWELAFAAGGGFDRTEPVGGKQVYVKVLDELFGKRFTTVCRNITPGADIRIDVSLEPVQTTIGGVSYLPSSSAYQDTNSLFAAMGTEVRGAYTNLQFQIASGRHLQNLDLLPPVGETVTVGDPGIEIETGPAAVVTNMDLLDDGVANGSIAKYFSAVQTGNIDWGGIYSEKSFSPINGARRPYYGLVFYDGNNYEIRKFRIEEFHSGATCSAWGLFGFLSNSAMPTGGRGEIRGIRVTDPYIDIKGEPYSSVGALGGVLAAINVTDCHVYVTDVLSAQSERFKITSQEACANLGGLVGTLATGRITYSSVSLPLISGNASTGVGGLAGHIQDNASIIDGCYANVGNLRNESKAGGTGIGMLVGETESYVANCYGVGTIGGKAQYIGGLVGGDGGSNSGPRYVVDSYAIISYKEVSSTNPVQAITHTDSDQVQNACYVVWPAGADLSKISFAGGRGLECTLDDLKGGFHFTGLPKWTTGGVRANPYNPSLGNIYPYPSPKGLTSVGTIHYGDWPV